ncbi:stAR-related lipid transfer protein 6 [Protopterus annectens]|uniref:stAR-related lipid transfer protein 6 n=1 Tax=Protopterus annectens TaxID=7888 RepID=UPI001CF9B6AF|nr:stAR-related lipid transfer protein 6 [Protopterus annectens]XP_043931080.1 stAR-related lipid transfer protein 6 [Protopterus annectens]
MMDYNNIADEVTEKILSYWKDDCGWKLAKHAKGVTVSWKPSTEYAGHLYRGEGIIEEIPEKIIPFMYLPDHRKKWDQSLKSYRLAEVIDQDTMISHSITHSYGMGIISSRDFVDLIRIKRYPCGTITTNSVSVKCTSCPPNAASVRGHNNPCGYVCSPLPENPAHSKIMVFVQPELGGMLPHSVVEAAVPNNLISLISDVRDGLKTLRGTA